MAYEKLVFHLTSENARRNAISECAHAPLGYVVSIFAPKRTLEENSKLHAMLGKISKSQVWAGQKHDIETWKRLLVAAWCRVDGSAVKVLPALDGAGVDIIPVRTSKLSKKECADLIEYIYAWGTEKGIDFDDDWSE